MGPCFSAPVLIASAAKRKYQMAIPEIKTCLAVIPARFASERFPGKPLADIAGRPMIQWVYESTCRCPLFSKVIVATDHFAIADAVAKFGGVAEMTRADHPTGTDRVAEAAVRYPEAEIVANVQGDQPFVPLEAFSALLEPFAEGPTIAATTIARPLSPESRNDPNVVKVACDQGKRALYFTRAAIPFCRESREVPIFHHLGFYAFRSSFLQTYATLPPTPIECAEKLEQMRVLEHGFAIRVGLVSTPIVEVNTPADLQRVEKQDSTKR
jgi:3-deoxy-manno-octulosonate cytidylyltransferase (CMP-KDO synthetase)